jgi:hypothetical protein
MNPRSQLAVFKGVIRQRSRLSQGSSRGLMTVPLWINGQAVNSSSGGTMRVRHSKTREETCEVVVAGETET